MDEVKYVQALDQVLENCRQVLEDIMAWCDGSLDHGTAMELMAKAKKALEEVKG